MKHPNTQQYDTADYDAFEPHEYQTDAHEQGNRTHNANLGLFGHTATRRIISKIIPVQLCTDKPCIESLGTSRKAKSRKK